MKLLRRPRLLSFTGVLAFCLAPGFQAGPAVEDAFLESTRCALCHSNHEQATAMLSPTGDDAGMYDIWSATMKAQSFRDPYWRAQVSREIKEHPGEAEEIQALCLRCHAPMLHHQQRLEGKTLASVLEASKSEMAQDGVSCTVCHQIQPDKLGDASTFSGRPVIKDEKKIFGPYKDPVPGPMRAHTGFTPTHGSHIRRSALCGSCHTLYTGGGPGQQKYLEQAPYLEWRNSRFSTEKERPAAGAKDCGECHMPELGEQRIARSPMGSDFLIGTRKDVRAHAFVGGNAFMLELLAKHREELGVPASAAALRRGARRTRTQLRSKTARLALEGARMVEGELRFELEVENLCGHKFPSAYPSRRAWIEVQVRAGRRLVWHSGKMDEKGRIEGISDPRRIPHQQLVTKKEQVQVYEIVPADKDGKPTTSLHAMQQNLKDNRLLPAGWTADGPHAEETAPQGIGEDRDFVAGRDKIQYQIPLPDAPKGRLRVLVWLRYQTVPPHWVEALRTTDTEEARRFVRMYDGMAKEPETIDITSAFFENEG